MKKLLCKLASLQVAVALLVLLISVVGTIAVSLLLPKQYTASTSLMVDVRSPDPLSAMTIATASSEAVSVSIRKARMGAFSKRGTVARVIEITAG